MFNVNYCGDHIYNVGPKGIYRHETTQMGTFPPNGFGLYDMHGNVWEWCADAWHNDYQGAPIDGSSYTSGEAHPMRVARGGSWLYDAKACRCANRDDYNPANRCSDIGFRVVLAPR